MTIEGIDYEAAVNRLKDVLVRGGLNIKSADPWYRAMKELYNALITNSRSSSSEMEEISEKADALIDTGVLYLESQNGLENFLTDETKKNDPFLSEFYQFWQGYLDAAHRLVTDPEFVYEYFSETYAGIYAKFEMVIMKIVQRANEKK